MSTYSKKREQMREVRISLKKLFKNYTQEVEVCALGIYVIVSKPLNLQELNEIKKFSVPVCVHVYGGEEDFNKGLSVLMPSRHFGYCVYSGEKRIEKS